MAKKTSATKTPRALNAFWDAFAEMNSVKDDQTKLVEWFKKMQTSCVDLGPDGFLAAMRGPEGLKPDVQANLAGLCKAFVVFGSFRPAVKVRFNVYDATAEKLQEIERDGWVPSKKAAVDGALEGLWKQVPVDYWNHREQLLGLLEAYLPADGAQQQVSLAMDPLGYAFLKDVARELQISQGAVLEAVLALWVRDRERALEALKEKTERMFKVLDTVEGAANELIAISPADRDGLVLLPAIVQDIRRALEQRLEGKHLADVLWAETFDADFVYDMGIMALYPEGQNPHRNRPPIVVEQRGET